MKGVFAVFFAVLLLAWPVQAETRPLSGQNDPAFQAALERWLKGDEAGALPALAALAAADNRAAQLLIGVIDVTPRFQGPWLTSQPRADRIALLRVPLGKDGAFGLSGGNWLREAAKTEPVARAWLHLWDGGASPEVVLEFARLGEDSAARTAAKRLTQREVKGFGPLAADPDFPDFARGLAIREWQASDPARAKAALAAVDPADPLHALIGTYHPDAAALLRLAETHAALRMLDRHLVVLCPDPPEESKAARARRLAEALELLGGWWGLADLGPPSEALIDPDRWALTVQGTGSLIRLLPDLDRQKMARMDRCLAFLSALVTEERGRLN